MIYLKTAEEIEKIAAACRLASDTLGHVSRSIAPGVTTRHLDTLARDYIVAHGGRPACLGYQGFPGTLCIEVNEYIVHGFPSSYALRPGDIVGLDIVVELDGYNGDMCYTFPVGDIAPEVRALCVTTKESLYRGIEAARSGHRIGDISHAVQTYCESRGYSVVREFCGHGIGRSMHESPEVANYGRAASGAILRPGMVIAIEPMINLGTRHVVIERDGWQARTRDRRPSAHYEHTVAITAEGPRILTTFEPIEQALGQQYI